ncbi:MAG: DUF1439 domain-containing protein [Candidatus Protistobacter heckmanni]|nr:DUF1439 domain-containing protein [Candidatus Protistobacter heckmanni]
MEQVLARKFPLQRNLANIADLQLSNPKLNLIPEGNRVRLDADAELARAGGNNPLALLLGNWGANGPSKGRVGVSGRPDYDAARKALVLRDPVVETLEFPDLPPAGRTLLEAARQPLAQLLRDVPLYQLDESQIRLAGDALDKLSLTVQADGILLRR